jgi:mycofactocin precursor
MTDISIIEPTGEASGEPATATEDSGEVRLLDGELLVEEISIDGMCGVY